MTKSIIITYNEAEESFLMTLFNRLKIKTYNTPNSFIPDDDKPPTKEEFLNSLQESVAEMKAHQRGEIEFQSIEDLLAELAEGVSECMKIEPTRKFAIEAKRLNKKFPSFKDDLAKKLAELLENPHEGESLGRNCYKVRMAITSKGKGKSGGSRLITCIKIEKETIYLLTIYDKSEREDLEDGELKLLLKQLEA